MKIRKGFVSNSSSSSFIVGAGKIKDLAKFKARMKKDGLSSEGSFYEKDIAIHSTTDLLENQGGWDYGIENGKTLCVTACVNSNPQVSTKFDPSKEEFYCIVNIGNDEGDDSFWNGDEMNYNIDVNYFGGNQAKVIELLQSDLLKDCTWDVGVDRNG